MIHAILAALAAAPLLASLPESVDERIEQGQKHLWADETEAALADFERAAELDGNSLRTRVWVARAWIEQGRINDALDTADELSKDNKGHGLDYLYGMAFAHKAQGYVASGVQDASVGMHFQDAMLYLQRATEAEPDLYRDGFLALAVAAWNSSPPELAVAAEAVDRAIEYFPKSAKAQVQKGRIAFSRYVSVRPDESRAAQAEEHWKTAMDAFGEAARLAAPPSTAEDRAVLFEAHKNRGDLLLWKRSPEEPVPDAATEEYGKAVGNAPDQANYQQLQGSALGMAGFGKVLEKGLEVFRASHDARDKGDATLLWWLGYARFSNGDNAGSEKAFLECLEKQPSYANSWFWIGHARYNAKSYAGAVDAFEKNFELDPSGLLHSIRQNTDYNVPVTRWLMDYAFNNNDIDGARAMAEVSAEAAATDSTLWNNLGLFERTYADLAGQGQLSLTPDQIAKHNERGLRAYRRALELSPDDPSYLNDTAVMLHYYVERDYDEARAMYVRARERAEEELARRDLPADVRPIYEIALRDAKNNLVALDEKLEREKQAQASAPDGGAGR